jgi:HEAT repeat protein
MHRTESHLEKYPMTETTVLLAALHDPDSHIRSRAALRLGDLREMAALDALVQALAADADLNVREDITWALVRLGEPAVAPLVALLRDGDAAARHSAAHALGKIGHVGGVDGLIVALHDTDAAVRAKSAFALGQIADPRAIPALASLLGSEDDGLREIVNQVLPEFGAAALPAVAAALDNPRPQTREQAADILGMIGDKAAVPALTRALSDAEWQVRFAAVTALGELGAGQTAAPLIEDPNPQVRAIARRMAKR